MNRLSQEPNKNAAATTQNSFLRSNPIMRKLDKVEERDASNAATYSGIAAKTIYFLLFSVVGIFAQVLLKPMLATGSILSFNIKNFPVEMYTTEMFVLLGVVIAAIVFQLLAFFARATTPVTGALYCATQGYFIAFLVFTVLPEEYRYLGVLALAITMMIILVMSILYATGVIRVTKKFKMVMITLFATAIGSSLLLLIGSFIPFTRNIVAAISGNYTFSIIFSVIFIIIAALFLICDFDTIEKTVKNELPKKYEWWAAFGLSFTVLWIYLKVLDLLITIFGNKK